MAKVTLQNVNQSLWNDSMQASPFQIGRHNGYITGYNEGLQAALQRNETYIIALFVSLAISLSANIAAQCNVRIPFIEKPHHTWVWRFIEGISWTVGWLFAGLMFAFLYMPPLMT